MSSPLGPVNDLALIDVRNYCSGVGELAALEKAIDGPLTEEWKKPARVRLQMPLEAIQRLVEEANKAFIGQNYDMAGVFYSQLLETGVDWNPVLKGRFALCLLTQGTSPEALITAWSFAKESLEQYPRDYAAFLAIAIGKFWTFQVDQAHQWLRLSKLCKNAPQALLSAIETRFKLLVTDPNSPISEQLLPLLKSLKGKTSDKVDLETDWDAYMETVQGITNMETFFEKVQEDESFWKVFISFFNELDASGPTMSLAEDTQEESPFSKISTSVMAAVGDHLDLTSIANLGATCKRLTSLTRLSGASRADVAHLLGVPKDNIPPQRGRLNLFGKIKAINEAVELLLSSTLPKDPVELEKVLFAALLKFARLLDQGINFLRETKFSLYDGVLDTIHELLMADLGTKSATKVLHMLEAKFPIMKLIDAFWTEFPNASTPYAVLADLISYEGKTGDNYAKRAIAAGYVASAVIDSLRVQHAATFHALIAARKEIQNTSMMRFPHWELTFEVTEEDLLSSPIEIDEIDQVEEGVDEKADEEEIAEEENQENEDGEIEDLTAEQKRDEKRAMAILAKMQETEKTNFSGVWHFVAHTCGYPDAGLYERGVMKLTHDEMSDEEAAEAEDMMAAFGKFVGIAQSTFMTTDGSKPVGELQVSLQRARSQMDSFSIGLEFSSTQSSICYYGRARIHGCGLIAGALMVSEGEESEMDPSQEPRYSFVAWRDAGLKTLKNDQDMSYKPIFEAMQARFKQVEKKNHEILQFQSLEDPKAQELTSMLKEAICGLRDLISWTPASSQVTSFWKTQVSEIKTLPPLNPAQMRQIVQGLGETDAEYKERSVVFNSVIKVVELLRMNLCYNLLTPYDSGLFANLIEGQEVDTFEEQMFFVRWTSLAMIAPYSVANRDEIRRITLDLALQLIASSQKEGDLEWDDVTPESSDDSLNPLQQAKKAKTQKEKPNSLGLVGTLAVAGAIVATACVGAFMLGRWLSKPKRNSQ